MDQKQGFPENISMEQAMKLAASPAGRQLIQALQQQGGSDFQSAVSSAASGDYTQAKKALSGLMEDPTIRELLQELGM